MTETNQTSAVDAETRSLQGLVATREDAQALLDALEKAFDYRGDVTLALEDGSSITGYIFDRRSHGSLADSCVRLLTADGDDPVSIGYDQIAEVRFTGKDTAHGKSFETWVQRFIEKRLAERGIQPERQANE